jgi:hypothetical protein
MDDAKRTKPTSGETAPVESPPEGDKRRYATPRLVTYGRLREITLGGSPGMFDSGSLATKKPF